MTISGATRVAGVIGDPVGHSLSPAIHNAAFAASGLDWVYVAFPVATGDAIAALQAMRALNIRGLSVTMPHKEAVAKAVDDLDPASAALGTVNTVVLEGSDRLVGYSTDGDGFVACLRESGVDPGGSRVAILGAGGAARSVIDALARSGAAEIAVINRSLAHAQRAVSIAPLIGRVGTQDDIGRADIVINATSVGMRSSAGEGSPELPCDRHHIRSGHVVADLVYYPLETALLRAARACGAAAIDGLGMLVHQAALQQQLWTGVRPDPRLMRAAAERELATRQR